IIWVLSKLPLHEFCLKFHHPSSRSTYDNHSPPMSGQIDKRKEMDSVYRQYAAYAGMDSNQHHQMSYQFLPVSSDDGYVFSNAYMVLYSPLCTYFKMCRYY